MLGWTARRQPGIVVGVSASQIEGIQIECQGEQDQDQTNKKTEQAKSWLHACGREEFSNIKQIT